MSYYGTVQYPWATEFNDYYNALKRVSPHVPATLRTAYNAILKSGQTITSQMSSGVTIDADIPNEFIAHVRVFADRLKVTYPAAAQIDEMAYAEPMNSGPMGDFPSYIGQQTGVTSDPYSQDYLNRPPSNPFALVEEIAAIGGMALLALLFVSVITRSRE